MEVLNYKANFNWDHHLAGCEVELTCHCSFKELNELKPFKALYLTDYDPSTIKAATELKPPKFGGMITLSNGKQVYIEKVIYNKPVVVVFWSDGVKTRSTCDKDDIWNPEFGLNLCIMKRFMSTEQLNSLHKDWFVEDALIKPITRTLKDVRKSQKDS